MSRLHFKALVTSSGHLSDKIFISSHFMKNLKTHPCNMAYMLYFQKIVGFTSLGRLEMGLWGAYEPKNTPKWPFSHDKIRWTTQHNVNWWENSGRLGAILHSVLIHTYWRTNKTHNLRMRVTLSGFLRYYFLNMPRQKKSDFLRFFRKFAFRTCSFTIHGSRSTQIGFFHFPRMLAYQWKRPEVKGTP